MRKIVLILVVIAVVGGGAWWWSQSTPEQREEAKTKAKIAAYDARNLARPSGPVKVSQGTPADAQQCRENIRRIESAKRAAAEQRGQSVGEVPLDAILQQMGIKALPKCPIGGDYRIMPLGTVVQCTIGSNGTVAPNDDHEVVNY